MANSATLEASRRPENIEPTAIKTQAVGVAVADMEDPRDGRVAGGADRDVVDAERNELVDGVDAKTAVEQDPHALERLGRFEENRPGASTPDLREDDGPDKKEGEVHPEHESEPQ